MTEEALKVKRARDKKWAQDNPEKAAIATKRWRNRQPKGRFTAYNREWRKKNPEKLKNQLLKSKFGITLEQYNSLIEKQEGRCAVCGIDGCPTGRALAVDHCHETKEIRGLLCARCNTMLGLSKDNIKTLKNAIVYLERQL